MRRAFGVRGWARGLVVLGLALVALGGCKRTPAAADASVAGLAVDAGSGAAGVAPFTLGPKPPPVVRTVVTLAPSLTETVIALGAGSRLVGVSRFDELPEVAALPRVGGFTDPSVEAVLALKPDLVLVQPAPGNRAPVEKMAELGTPVLALPMHTLAEVTVALRAAGRALGVAERGEALAAEIEAKRAQVREKGRALAHPRVLFVYELSPLIVAGPGSFADELLADAGAVNAAEGADKPYTTYSAETALRLRPDIVIDATHATGTLEPLRSLEGLKQARWIRLTSQDLRHPGPRLAHGLEALFTLVHGGATDAGYDE